MVTEPAATAVTTPLEFTVATALALDDQATAVEATAPVEVRGVAVSCVVCGGDNVLVGAVTSMRVMVTTGVVGPWFPSPQLLSVSTALAARAANLKRAAIDRRPVLARPMAVPEAW